MKQSIFVDFNTDMQFMDSLMSKLSELNTCKLVQYCKLVYKILYLPNCMGEFCQEKYVYK